MHLSDPFIFRWIFFPQIYFEYIEENDLASRIYPTLLYSDILPFFWNLLPIIKFFENAHNVEKAKNYRALLFLAVSSLNV